MKNTIVILLAFSFLIPSIKSQYSISGSVFDSNLGIKITECKITVWNHAIENYSNNNGEFFLDFEIPGFYTLTFSKEGYHSRIYTFSLDSGNKSVIANIELISFEFYTDTIDVTAKYFVKKEEINTSFSNVMYDELRKTPGALEDVIRYFSGAPGVSTGNDVGNQIIIRGGSPAENLILVDGIELQNPNHYAAPGSSSGLISYINLKLVKDVDFFTGGFPVNFGDKLSSVIDIRLREGNRNKHIRDVNISAIGYGAFVEGPISSKSSYMFSARKSYLELIKNNLGTNILPEYSDFNTKLNYDLNNHDKISLVGLLAFDHAEPFKDGDFKNDTADLKMFSAGFNFKREKNKYIYRFTSAYNWSLYKVNFLDYKLDINDNLISLKQELLCKSGKGINVLFFSGIKYIFSNYKIDHWAGYNYSNFYAPGISINTNLNTFKVNSGINISVNLLGGKMILNTGLRFDFFQFINDKLSISPRLGITYKIKPGTSINANAGILFQSPEILWVVVDENNKNLRHIKVNELVLGLEHFIGNDIMISIEPYIKQYFYYPVSIYDPYFIFINSGVDVYPNFLDRAVSFGKGYYYGVDVGAQKKNISAGLYGTISYSYTKSAFVALVGDIQPAEFDYGNQVISILGYKFNFGFSISSRFKFAQGRPYTPFDIQKSRINARGIYERNLYNKARMPDYVRLDIRVDQALNFGETHLNVYIELINVFNRINYHRYYWDQIKNHIYNEYHFMRTPIIGISCQF